MTTTTNRDDANPHTVEPQLISRKMTRQTYEAIKEKMPQHVTYWQVALETLFKDADELRETLLRLGPDGLDAANVCRDFMLCREQLDDVKLMLQQAAGRTLLMLEDMEARRD